MLVFGQSRAKSSGSWARTALVRPPPCASSPATCLPPKARRPWPGFDVFDQPLEAKRRTGYLPETPPLYPDMTVREYLRFVAKIKGVRGNVNDRVDAVMKKTWVADMANRHCGKLSKGYKQRVGLAQALIHEPEVLVLDEPTAGLDPKQIIETRQLIRELAGTTPSC
jgi:ABC-2 type transport system ATP-binding protein